MRLSLYLKRRKKVKKKVVDLYAILQIHKEATQKEVQKAFHALSKRHHPDVGGNPQEFQRINSAYEILCDPKKRAFYDRTGCIKQNENETYAIAASIIAKAIDEFLSNLRQSVFSMDFIGCIIKKLEEEQEEIDKKRKVIRKNIKIINKLKGKTSRKKIDSSYPPVVFQFFEQKRNEFIAVLRQLNEAISYNKIAILMLQEYSFDYEKIVVSQTVSSYGYNNGSAFITFAM
jgi:curved DNA-binding protein CbpA